MTAPRPGLADRPGSQFAQRIDELVGSARAARDSAFNTLDAINRQTRSACDALVREAQQFVAAEAERAGAAATAEPERDTRFDPEDEWELPAGSGPSSAEHRTSAAADDHDPDYPDTDYPDTWLR